MALNPREVILEATRRLSASDGLHGLTMRKVAAEVGVTAPALYRHFGNKAELIEALIEEARAAFLGFLTDSLSGATPWERLQLAQRAFLRFALERPDAYELLLMTPNQMGLFGMPAGLDQWRGEPPASFRVCVDRVAECIRSGDLREGDPTELALTLSGTAHGLVCLYLAGRFGPDPAVFERLFETCMNHLYQGLRAAPKGTPS